MMPSFASEDFDLHYHDSGKGEAVVLLHGFGMSARTCWEANGWYELLNNNGYRAIGLDSRGHGDSSKSAEPSDYDADKMKDDVIRLMDHLGEEQAHFIGHSMGGRTVLNLLAESKDRAFAAVVVSNGENVFHSPDTSKLGEALLAKNPDLLPPGRAEFARMLLSLGNNSAALAAYCRNPRPPLSGAYLAQITTPVKIVCGANDPVAGDPAKLGTEISGSHVQIVPSREHTDILASSELHDAAIEWIGHYSE